MSKRAWRESGLFAVLSGALLILLLGGATPGAAGRAKQDDAQAQDQTQSKPKIEHKKHENKDAEAKKEAKRDAEAEAASSLPAVLVDDNGDPRSLDLYYGIGGKQDAPDPHGTYTFISEDLSQTQPKFDVKDAEGRRWRIKLGIEPKSETAATRLVWAAGYFSDEDYYLPDVTVQNLPRLKRGEKYVDGQTAEGARLRLDSKNKKIAYWSWKQNPFVNTRDFNGLRVMMALLDNWDLMTRNNKVYAVDGQRRFVVSDLGASFGRSGNEVTRRKDDLAAYAKTPFIRKTTADQVDFLMHTRPLPPMILGFGAFKGMPDYYPEMVAAQRVVQHVPRADARWIGQRLAQLSNDQIRDCFRAAGYSEQEIDGFTNVVRQRIEQLAAL